MTVFHSSLVIGDGNTSPVASYHFSAALYCISLVLAFFCIKHAVVNITQEILRTCLLCS